MNDPPISRWGMGMTPIRQRDFFQLPVELESRAVAAEDRVVDQGAAQVETAAQHHPHLAQGLHAAVAEARRRVRQLVDPGRMEAGLELADGAQELAGGEGGVVMEQQVDGRVLDLQAGRAVVLDLEREFALEERQVLVLEMEDGVEGSREEGVRL
jgi:hypothetical protein